MEMERYRRKRDFSLTPEPPPGEVIGRGPLVFVVQKHRARQLHYDFRLEVDGVLKSWSVPKGPSLDPGARHLAVMVEDHPVDYASFEGIIPKGEYGAGEVIVWDRGTYSPEDGGDLRFGERAAANARMRQGLAKGKVSFFLRGQRLKGSWTLVRMQGRERDWLLMKHQDGYAQPASDVLKEERSVLSGRTLDEVREQRPPDSAVNATPSVAQVPGARPALFPSALAPMLARLARGPFSHPDWIFEPKLDGYRIIALIKDHKVTLLSRRGNDVTRRYGALVPDLSRQPASGLVLDGEVIALDARGRQCFQCLQQYLSSQGRPEDEPQFPLIYYVFDILYLDGYDLRGAELRSRKGLLRQVLAPTGRVRPTDYFVGEGERVYQAAVSSGLEGVMAKEMASTYQSGRRSGKWLKVKAVQSDEFVIGGYSAAEAGRARTFSSLLLGYYDSQGDLLFAGHVGSGFDGRTLGELRKRLDAIRTERCPFAQVPPLNAPTTWVRPELVAEVRFSEWTKEGRLRIPVFLRLREDKAPAEVRRAEPVAVPQPITKAMAGNTEDLLRQLRAPRESFNIEVEGERIRLNNMDKVLWPETASRPALTKRHLLTYLATVSSFLLPHLKDRPLTLSRYPDGITGEHFYQKHWGHPLPRFVPRVNIHEEAGRTREYLVCANLPTLLWLGQVADIEFHTWFSRVSDSPDLPQGPADADYRLSYPDFIVFDLDPYIYSGKEPAGAEPELNREGFVRVSEVALWLKEVLDELRLQAFIKTSGKTGLHLYVPITRRLDYVAVRSAAELIGQFLLNKHPREVTTEWPVDRRTGKVFIDYGQNVRGKTLASVYSPRPTPGATVSTPLRWEELGRVYPTDFTILTTGQRLKEMGELWADILSAKQDLKTVLER